MPAIAPIPLTLVVFDASDFPDTDAIRKFVFSPRFPGFLHLAEYGLYDYRPDGAHGPGRELARHAAAHLPLDLQRLESEANAVVSRPLEPTFVVSDQAAVVMSTRTVLAELAMKLDDEETTRYLLGLFERVRTRRGAPRVAPPGASSPPATPERSR